MEGRVYTAWLYTIPVGFLLVENNSSKVQTIRGLWVSSDFRNLGIGKKLMTWLIQESAGVETRVSVTDGAQEFYKKFGFEIGERREDFPDQFRAVRKVRI